MNIGDRLKKILIGLAIKYITSDSVKEAAIVKLNQKIDIPILSEEMEAELLDTI